MPNAELEKTGLNTLVVDDEALARARLLKMLEGEPHIASLAEAADGDEAIAYCKNSSVQLVLLDIEMPGLNGLEVAYALNELAQPPAIVFCTAYDEFALEAFERSAIDYLLKPVVKDRLMRAVARAAVLSRTALDGLNEVQQSKEQANGFIWIKSARGRQRIEIQSLRMLRAEDKYVSAWTDKQEFLLEGSLKAWEQRLGSRFLRIHRSTLVAIDHFSGWEKTADGQYLASLDGLSIKPVISRRLVPEIQRRFKQA